MPEKFLLSSSFSLSHTILCNFPPRPHPTARERLSHGRPYITIVLSLLLLWPLTAFTSLLLLAPFPRIFVSATARSTLDQLAKRELLVKLWQL